MKFVNFYFTALLCFASLCLFAQTPHQIEADLLKSFKKIEYWDQQRNKDTSFSWTEKLSRANYDFAQKLQFYAQKYPTTIKYPFHSLVREHLDISTSTDGLFRIYSWDTETGGTMYRFEDVMQYRSGAKIKAIIDTPRSDGDVRPAYDKVYTLKAGDNIYYLARFFIIESSRYSGYGITAFTIKNDSVIEAKIIKTRSGLHSDLFYECDFRAIDDITYRNLPEIRFNEATNMVYLPLVDQKGKMTKKFILYQFTGQYFERVRN